MKFDKSVFSELVQFLEKSEIDNPMAPFIKPQEVNEKLDIALNEEGISSQQLVEILKNIVVSTPKTSSNRFFNQLFGGRNSEAVLGDLLATVLNNSMYTYKVAGPQVIIEKEVINQTLKLAGYSTSGSGTIAPGGSMCNMMACIMARDLKHNKVRAEGVLHKMTIYTSQESHYSITKNAAFIGVGMNNVRKIETNSMGEMLPEALEKQIEKDLKNGFVPFFINVTAGTTVLGAFDPIVPTVAIAQKFDLWVHVDGAYFGGVLWSRKYKYLLNGIETTNSFSVNAHKMLGTPLSCSILVTQHKNQLFESFSSEASYLYQTDDEEFNPGKISMQCGRRNDALKIWTIWKSRGHLGMEKLVDHLFYLAKTAYDYVINHQDYQVYSNQPSLSVCFNYKNISAEKICTQLYEDSTLMVGYGSFREDVFIRLILVNGNNSQQDILNFFQVLEAQTYENLAIEK